MGGAVTGLGSLGSSGEPGRIVAALRVFEPAMALLARCGRLRVWEGPAPIPPAELRAWLVDAAGLYCSSAEAVDRQLLDAAPGLRVVSSVAVGIDNIDLAACTERGIPVGHTPDVLTDTVADHAVALLLAVARRVAEGSDFVKGGHWTRLGFQDFLGVDLHHSTVGIIGMGRIGTALAARLAAFSTRILYSDPRRCPEIERRAGAEWRELEALLAEAEHVVICAPLTAETRGLISATRLARMRPDATLVNVSRGGLVDTDALVVALREGVIARAALDVTDPEPLPRGHPLLDLPNCLVVPHLGSATLRTRQAMALVAAENLAAGLEGRPLVACANPEVYRDGGAVGRGPTGPASSPGGPRPGAETATDR